MFYVFHGEDTHSQQETLDTVKGKLGDPEMMSLNTSVLEGRNLRVNDLIDLCNAMPFLAPKRLIVVENYFNSKPDKKDVDKLIDYLENIPDSARLFFLENKALAKNARILKLADKSDKGFAKQFDRPTGPKLEQWIVAKVKSKGGRIQPRSAAVLALNAGNDLALLENEIEKLVLYKGVDLENGEGSFEPAEIRPEDIEKLSPSMAEANIFDLVDALGNRNGQQASRLLQRKLEEGTEPFLIFSMFIRQFRLLIQVKELSDKRVSPPEIAKAVRIHKFVAQKLTQQSRSFSLSQLERIYLHLLDIDVRVKTGKEDIVTALNMLVFSLT